MISFDEFKAKATDVISSGIQYERATTGSSERQALMADAGRRAALANAQNVKLNSSALPDVESRLQAAFPDPNPNPTLTLTLTLP
tara:strand:- start:223 stop:477 length:255 start_codon:yes stop_codon:yes gene_type:complete